MIILLNIIILVISGMSIVTYAMSNQIDTFLQSNNTVALPWNVSNEYLSLYSKIYSAFENSLTNYTENKRCWDYRPTRVVVHHWRKGRWKHLLGKEFSNSIVFTPCLREYELGECISGRNILNINGYLLQLYICLINICYVYITYIYNYVYR